MEKLDPMKGISSRRWRRSRHGNRTGIGTTTRGDRQVCGHWAQVRAEGGGLAQACPARVLFRISNTIKSSPWLDSFSIPPPKVLTLSKYSIPSNALLWGKYSRPKEIVNGMRAPKFDRRIVREGAHGGPDRPIGDWHGRLRPPSDLSDR